MHKRAGCCTNEHNPQPSNDGGNEVTQGPYPHSPTTLTRPPLQLWQASAVCSAKGKCRQSGTAADASLPLRLLPGVLPLQPHICPTVRSAHCKQPALQGAAASQPADAPKACQHVCMHNAAAVLLPGLQPALAIGQRAGQWKAALRGAPGTTAPRTCILPVQQEQDSRMELASA